LEFNIAFVMFFCGALAHALGIRLFGLWSKKVVYRTTYISCLAILKMSEGFAKDVVKASGVEDEEDIETAFTLWRHVALNSLNTVLADVAWRSNCINDWSQAMKTISNLQDKRSRRDEV
jgi:uncharacterized membrane protein YccF (DUF307 family)